MQHLGKATFCALLGTIVPGLLYAQDIYVVSARDQYGAVRAAASAVSQDIELILVRNGSDVVEGGQAHNWGYFFKSNSLNEVIAFAYEQDDGMVHRISGDDPGLPIALHVDMEKLPDDWIDSPQAVAAADSNGGNAFRARHATAYKVDVFLLPASDGGRNQLYPDPTWLVMYISEHEEVGIPIDARTGAFLDVKTATARAYLDEIMSMAHDAASDAELIQVRTFDVNPDGESTRWMYFFQSTSHANLYAFDVIEGRMGESHDPIRPSDILYLGMPALPTGWLDSDAALSQTEQLGGSAFRQTHNDWKIDALVAILDSGWAEWHVFYRSASGEDQFNIDAIGAEPVAARNTLGDVFTRARQEEADAQLVFVSSGSLDLEGRANEWFYIFKSTASQRLFQVAVRAASVLATVNPIEQEGIFTLDMATLPDTWLDSDSAIVISERLGGAEFRNTHPNTNIDATVTWLEWQVERNLNVRSRPMYLMTYVSATGDTVFVLDAVLGAYDRLIRTTAREMLNEVADTAAARFPSDTRLVNVNSIRVDSSGYADHWRYRYESAAENQRYPIWVLGGRVIWRDFSADLTAPPATPVPEHWIDSPIAMATAEDDGGREFRRANAANDITLSLEAFEDGSSPPIVSVVWNGGYGSETVFQAFSVDAADHTVSAGSDRLPGADLSLSSYPNPFSRSATIEFALDQPGDVSLVVYDILGRKRLTVIDGFLRAGTHTIPLNASMLEPGHYFFILNAGDLTRHGRMVSVR